MLKLIWPDAKEARLPIGKRRRTRAASWAVADVCTRSTGSSARWLTTLIFTRRIHVEHSSYSRGAAMLLVCVPVATGYLKLNCDAHQDCRARGGEGRAARTHARNRAGVRLSLRSAVPSSRRACQPLGRCHRWEGLASWVSGFGRVGCWLRSNFVTLGFVTCQARVSIAGYPIGPGRHVPHSDDDDDLQTCSSALVRRSAQLDPAGALLHSHSCILFLVPVLGCTGGLPGCVKQIVRRCALKRPVQHISRPPHLCPSRTHNSRRRIRWTTSLRPGSPENR
jgi:hypothetical protein